MALYSYFTLEGFWAIVIDQTHTKQEVHVKSKAKHF